MIKKTIACYVQNVGGIASMTDVIHEFLMHTQYYIVLLQETWFDFFTDIDFIINNTDFQAITQDRVLRAGGAELSIRIGLGINF